MSYESIFRKILFKIKSLFDDVRGLSFLLAPLYDTANRDNKLNRMRKQMTGAPLLNGQGRMLSGNIAV